MKSLKKVEHEQKRPKPLKKSVSILKAGQNTQQQWTIKLPKNVSKKLDGQNLTFFSSVGHTKSYLSCMLTL